MEILSETGDGALRRVLGETVLHAVLPLRQESVRRLQGGPHGHPATRDLAGQQPGAAHPAASQRRRRGHRQEQPAAAAELRRHHRRGGRRLPAAEQVAQGTHRLRQERDRSLPGQRVQQPQQSARQPPARDRQL